MKRIVATAILALTILLAALASQGETAPAPRAGNWNSGQETPVAVNWSR